MNSKAFRKIAVCFVCVFILYTLADEAFSFYKRQGLAYKCLSKANAFMLEKEFAEAQPDFPPETEYLENNFLIAHAFGGVDGISYTNSLEAFEENYAGGHRIFEVDFCLTSDGRLVALHDWKHFNEISGTSGVLSYADFKSAKICEKYTPLGIDDIVGLMAAYSDFYVVTDKFFPGSEGRLVPKLIEACGADETLLDRFIIQVYTDRNFLKIDKIHHFKNYIYTLYVRGNEELEQNAKFCVAHGIPTVTMWYSWATDDAIRIYEKYKIKIFAHTVNDEAEYARLTGGGYSEFIQILYPRNRLMKVIDFRRK